MTTQSWTRDVAQLAQGMTYPVLVTAEVAREETLGITENAWAEWVKRKIVEPVPGTKLYAREDLETAHKKAKEVYAKPDNTIRIDFGQIVGRQI